MYVSKFIIEYLLDLYLRYTLFVIVALVLIVIVEWKKNWVFFYLLSELLKTFLVYLLSLFNQVGFRKIIKWQKMDAYFSVITEK